MLEVVFTSSAAGAISMALKQASFPACADEPTSPAKTKRDHRSRKAGIPLDGGNKNLAAFPLALSIGEISELGIGAQRQATLARLMGIFPFSQEVVEELLELSHNSYALLLEQVQTGEPIRVWASQSPDEMCGLYWLMAQLRPIGLERLEVTLVQLPEWEARPDGCIVQYTGWGEVEPYRFGQLALLGRKLPANYLRALADCWNTLQQENAPLRAVLNGKLVSATESLYDPLILRELETQKDQFSQARLVGQVLGKYQLGMQDAWIALRIEQFIRDGLLTPITEPEPDLPLYHRILQKAKKQATIA